MARSKSAAWIRRMLALLVLLLLAAVVVSLWGYRQLTGSLPHLDGVVAIRDLGDTVRIERDALGVPTIRGSSRLDVTRALGFVHAQERFFQMDLMRRRAAGELAELLGEGALPLDRHHRLHRMRLRARAWTDASSEAEKRLLDAYANGVNRGLETLRAKPFEYFLLRQEPSPWKPEDTALVVLSMFFELNDSYGRRESNLALLEEILGRELADFLSPEGSEWDAPLRGPAFSTPPLPGPESFRRIPPVKSARGWNFEDTSDFDPGRLEPPELGSNNWALAGTRSQNGSAILANDMHLRHAVPNIWFRARMVWEPAASPTPADSPSEVDAAVGSEGALHKAPRQLVGVTLPGTFALVAGSNGSIAWGFTNSNGDWGDLVELELNPRDPNLYRTPEGWRAFETIEEHLQVAGGEPETLELRTTIWGPVIDRDHRGRWRALRWIAHDQEAVNWGLLELDEAESLEAAIAIAKRSGLPPQNFVVADSKGSIAWTIIGRIPKRFGFDGRRPTSWADGERGWDGWLGGEDYPTVVNPSEGAIWTANARVVSGEALERIGSGGYALGARAKQIRDDLLALREASEADMLAVQLDDRALFLERWRKLFLSRLTDQVVENQPRLRELRKVLEEDWTGRASVNSAAYRLVKELRLAVFRDVFGPLTAACREADERFRLSDLGQWEGPLWKLVHEAPAYWIPPPYRSWEEALPAIMNRALEGLADVEVPLASLDWGDRNRSEIRHPLSAALPRLSGWLDVASHPLPGDIDMPRVQSPTHGASERLVVSPGHEENGILHMPGGQSGHPLSPYYRGGQEDWEKGGATPLLPGPAAYRLELRPAN